LAGGGFRWRGPVTAKNSSSRSACDRRCFDGDPGVFYLVEHSLAQPRLMLCRAHGDLPGSAYSFVRGGVRIIAYLPRAWRSFSAHWICSVSLRVCALPSAGVPSSYESARDPAPRHWVGPAVGPLEFWVVRRSSSPSLTIPDDLPLVRPGCAGQARCGLVEKDHDGCDQVIARSSLRRIPPE